MPNILTKQIKIDNAKTFLDNLTIPESSLYLMLGRPNPWADDKNPPEPLDNEAALAKLWDESIGLKRIFPLDAAPVVRRINWQSFKVYDEYNNQDVDLWEKNFYVLNSQFDVYKCIDNAKGSQSIVEPTGRNLNIFKTQDGYKWKYLYSISVSDQLRFLTRNWMPVRLDPDVALVAKPGGIEHVKIISGGTDYSVFANVIITGDGTGANIVAKPRIGVIYDMVVDDPGKDYRYSDLSIEDTSGQYANVIPIISPTLGHGGDPVAELGAYYVMLNIKTEYNEGGGDIPVDIKYRNLCLVKNPNKSDNKLAVERTLSSLYSLEYITSSGNFINNEVIRGDTSNATIYSVFNDGNLISRSGTIKFIQSEETSNFKDLSVGELLIGETSGVTATLLGLYEPEVKHDTGRIIYVENRTPVSRFIDQAENIHFVLEF